MVFYQSVNPMALIEVIHKVIPTISRQLSKSQSPNKATSMIVNTNDHLFLPDVVAAGAALPEVAVSQAAAATESTSGCRWKRITNAASPEGGSLLHMSKVVG